MGLTINAVLDGFLITGGNTIYNNETTAVAEYSLFDDTVTGYTATNRLTTATSPFMSAISTQFRADSPAIDTGNPASITRVSRP